MSRETRHQPPEASHGLRRNLLLGAAAAGGLIALDLSSPFLLWKHGRTEIIADDQDPAPPARCLAIAGLGHNSGKFLADELHNDLPGVVDYMNFSNRGISVPAVADALEAYYSRYFSSSETPPVHNVFLHSMALVVYLRAVGLLLEQERYVPPVDTLISLSGPMNIEHTAREHAARLISRFPYPGGIASKLSIEFYQRYETERFRITSLGKAAVEAFHSSYREISPPLWTSQVRLLHESNIEPDVRYSRLFRPDSKIYYFGDPDDHVVKTPLATSGLKEFAEPLGIEPQIILMPGEGHAPVQGLHPYLHSLSLGNPTR